MIRATVVVLGHTTYPANKVLITVLIPTTFFWVPDNDKAHDTTAINAFPVSLFSIVFDNLPTVAAKTSISPLITLPFSSNSTKQVSCFCVNDCISFFP